MPLQDLANPTPTGVVQLVVVGADNVRAADIGGGSWLVVVAAYVGAVGVSVAVLYDETVDGVPLALGDDCFPAFPSLGVEKRGRERKNEWFASAMGTLAITGVVLYQCINILAY